MLAACLVFILLPLIYGAVELYRDYARYGPAAAAWSWPYFAGSAGLLLAAVALVLPPLLSPAKVITVHKNGLGIRGLHSFLPGRNPSLFIPWSQIQAVTVDSCIGAPGRLKSGPEKIYHTAVLHFHNRSPLRLSDHGRGAWIFSDLPEMISRIKFGLYPYLLRSLHPKMVRGEWIQFGPVAVHPHAFQMENGPFSTLQVEWSCIERIHVEAGALVVELTQPGHPKNVRKLPASRIPNLELLVQLINTYAEG
jgi:hypothetical protein